MKKRHHTADVAPRRRAKLLTGIAAAGAAVAALLAPIPGDDPAAAWVPVPEATRCEKPPTTPRPTIYLLTGAVSDTYLPSLQRAAAEWDSWSGSTGVSIKTVARAEQIPSGGFPVGISQREITDPVRRWAAARPLCLGNPRTFVGGEMQIFTNRLPTTSQEFKQYVFTHELGHILGLAHSDGQAHCSTVMLKNANEGNICRMGTAPYVDDIAGVAAVWRPLALRDFPAEARISTPVAGRYLKGSTSEHSGSWNSMRFVEQDQSGLFDWTYVPDRDGQWGWLVNDKTGQCATAYSSRLWGSSVYMGFCDNDQARWKGEGFGDGRGVLVNKSTGKCLGSASGDDYVRPDIECRNYDHAWLTIERKATPRANPATPPRRAIVGAGSERCVTHGGSQLRSGRLSIRDCDLVLADPDDSWSLHAVDGGYVLGVHDSATPELPDADAVSAEECATTVGQEVELQTCTGSPSQTWTLGTDGTIRNNATGTCLNVSGNATANDSPLIVYACGTASNMVWSIPAELEADVISLAPVSSPSGSVLGTTAAPAGDADARVRSALTKNTTGDAARWKYLPITGTYGGLVKNVDTGTCLRWRARNAQAALDQACDGSDSSYRWGPTQTKQGNWILQSQYTGECLGVMSSSDSEGAVIGTRNCDSQRSQEWRSVINPPARRAATNAPSVGGNVAMTGVASQSSDYGPRWTARLAIDGRAEDALSAETLTHTKSEQYPWWQVDLGRSWPIGAVTVYNRTDCCAERSTDLWILASNTPFPATGSPQSIASMPGVVSTHSTSNTAPALGWSPGGSFRYVRVQLGTSNPLSLREVTITQ